MTISLILFLICYSFSQRPVPGKRLFSSSAVDSHIELMRNKIFNHKLFEVYEACFPNTLDTTVYFNKSDTLLDTFVITGDIEAMWQRDSVFQNLPYLEFVNEDPQLKEMVQGLINRHIENLMIDPYANAFNKNDTKSPWFDDYTTKIVNGTRVKAMNLKIWERKYELDSSVSVLFFGYQYFKRTHDSSFINENYMWAVQNVIALVEEQSMGTDEELTNGGPFYEFQRSAQEPLDSLHRARGNPGNSCGLVKSAFRASDDATFYPYNIPENAFLSVTFSKIAKLLSLNRNASGLINRTDVSETIESLQNISKRVKKNIYKHGVIYDPYEKQFYFAYEVDCYGNHLFIDDANYPSLLSLPFFKFVSRENVIYQNTRKRIFSKKNPYFFEGRLGPGLGSPHTERKWFWPLATIMRALTSDDDSEIKSCIDQLVESTYNTTFMHESVFINNPEKFTRSWFAWANSFFGYLINKVAVERPHLIFK